MATLPFTIRLDSSEVARIAAIQTRLQARYDERGPKIRVTQRMALLEALDALEKRLDDLDRKR